MARTSGAKDKKKRVSRGAMRSSSPVDDIKSAHEKALKDWGINTRGMIANRGNDKNWHSTDHDEGTLHGPGTFYTERKKSGKGFTHSFDGPTQEED